LWSLADQYSSTRMGFGDTIFLCIKYHQITSKPRKYCELEISNKNVRKIVEIHVTQLCIVYIFNWLWQWQPFHMRKLQVFYLVWCSIDLGLVSTFEHTSLVLLLGTLKAFRTSLLLEFGTFSNFHTSNTTGVMYNLSTVLNYIQLFLRILDLICAYVWFHWEEKCCKQVRKFVFHLKVLCSHDNACMTFVHMLLMNIVG